VKNKLACLMKKTCAWKQHALGSTATASNFVWIVPWFGPFVE